MFNTRKFYIYRDFIDETLLFNLTPIFFVDTVFEIREKIFSLSLDMLSYLYLIKSATCYFITNFL